MQRIGYYHSVLEHFGFIESASYRYSTYLAHVSEAQWFGLGASDVLASARFNLNIYIDIHSTEENCLFTQLRETDFYLYSIEACRQLKFLLHQHPSQEGFTMIAPRNGYILSLFLFCYCFALRSSCPFNGMAMSERFTCF